MNGASQQVGPVAGETPDAAATLPCAESPDPLANGQSTDRRGAGPRLTCPKCRRRAYVVCSNRACTCWRKIPRGKRGLRWTRDGERERCPYCGFTAHADYWFERELNLYAPPVGEEQA